MSRVVDLRLRRLERRAPIAGGALTAEQARGMPDAELLLHLRADVAALGGLAPALDYMRSIEAGEIADFLEADAEGLGLA
jgi:hypothetical protein